MLFANRADAGRRLARQLLHFRDRDVVVLGLPRGGVPVAFEVATALHAPLDVILVRKLGVPYQPELGMGAIGEDGVQILNDRVLRTASVTDRQIQAVIETERLELDRRAKTFRGEQPRAAMGGRIAIVVDDGIATGSTARAACQVARSQGARRVILAAPVAPPGWAPIPGEDADELVCVERPRGFRAIGQFYDDFTQTSDAEVIRCLDAARLSLSRRPGPPTDRDVIIPVGAAELSGHLAVPAHSSGLVVFAHGSGSSRHSPRNRYVAGVLNYAGLGTLLFDLLTPAEERDRSNVFDIELLGGRLADVARWLADQPGTRNARLGFFGASTGAAAALWAAAEGELGVAAIVSRGGRPDLAGDRLGLVTAPTRLIVGSADTTVLELNREAQGRLQCESDVVVVPDATHLFEEPGTLQLAAEAARDWFTNHLWER